MVSAEYERQNLESDVTQILHEIGIPAHIKGYQYLRDAIILSVSDKGVLPEDRYDSTSSNSSGSA